MALVMSFEDWVSLYGTISIVSGGSVASGHSLDSLKTRQLGDVCRFSTSADPMILRIDFTPWSTSTAMAAGVLRTSGISTTVTFKTYNTLTLRTTSSAYAMLSNLPWRPSVGDLHDTPAGAINRLEISFSQLAGSTLDVGRIWYGPAFQSLRASGREWESGPEDSGGVALSRSGAAYPRVGVVSRTVNIPLTLLEEAEIYGSAYGGSQGAKSTVALETIAHDVGKTGELFCFQETSTNAMRPIYGHFLEMPRFRKRAGIYYDTTLAIREER